MNDADIAKKTGQTSERIPAYKLNEVRMNGDDGSFSLVELLSPKNAETGKYNSQKLGSSVDGVILKMRWKLSKFKEGEPSLNTSEYDNKSKDKVVLFGTNERGIAQNIKERFALTTQRVLYVYLPKQGEVVRLIVKPSGFSRKNPNDPAGLFDFQNEHEKASTYIHKFWTTFSCKFQEGKNQDGSPNKRKDHFSMTFACGKPLTEEQQQKIYGLIEEVDSKTTVVAAQFAETYEPTPEKEIVPGGGDYPTEDVNPDDIPF
jgi:hypothetical protein